MSNQSKLALESEKSGPVECLGQSFPSDAARREHFLGLLAEKLQDPAFRDQEGFPLGEDEDILALSDPPYYTACPNPWLGEFIKCYGRPYNPKENYHREPFVADVKEGKNHPIYNAHSYHTKVPHRAIMRYILHYTEPGDVVFDGFCGTGMTGIAAQLCGDRHELQELGYRIGKDGEIIDESGKQVSKIGARLALLNDLAPAATFIAANYNQPTNPERFAFLANRILSEVESEFAWMYETLHVDKKTKCPINFTVWSDVFICPECGSEIVFWDAAVDPEKGGVKDTFECAHCRSETTKRRCERAWRTIADPATGTPIRQAKQQPVIINYSYNGKRVEKRPDANDLASIGRAEEMPATDWYPTNRMMEGGETRRNDDDGITHAHHFYSARNRAVLAAVWRRVKEKLPECPTLGLWFTSAHVWTTRQNRLLVSNYFKKKGGVIGQTLQGTLYISSVGIETNALERFRLRVSSVPFTSPAHSGVTSTGSTAAIMAPDCSVDYLFVDPPFGANIAYSELNHLWESWLGVFTAYKAEAIENKPHGKTLSNYQSLMRTCFQECFRLLKPGRWVTVEFSNTHASVWNSIQSALGEVGFVVANVSVLEKSHKGFRAVTTTTAVKQDLVISAYKPNGGLEDRFEKSGHTVEGVWDFMKTHLRNLPVAIPRGGELEFIAERDPRILYDRMVAFYVGHGVPVPLSSAEFQAGLGSKFPEREGMVFLPEQVAEWDKKRAQMEGVGQMSIFVEDEKSAINWLRNSLKGRPRTYQDIQPEFMKQLGASWKKFETRPELRLLLEQNFLRYEGGGEVPSQIHSYLSTQNKDLRQLPKDDSRLQHRAKDRWYVPDPSKAVDVENLRNKRLRDEFWSLCAEAGISRPIGDSRQGTLPVITPATKKSGRKKLKEVRTEAVRLGFKELFAAQDYSTILAISAHLPDNVIEEDEHLRMIHDVAEMRADG